MFNSFFNKIEDSKGQKKIEGTQPALTKRVEEGTKKNEEIKAEANPMPGLNENTQDKVIKSIQPKKPINPPQAQNKKQVAKATIEKEDIYQEDTEKRYHNIAKMQSINVLESELNVCDKIIQYKCKEKFDDADIWESKKELIKVNKDRIVNLIDNHKLDIATYSTMLLKEFDYEKKLLELIKQDKRLNVYEIPALKTRIEERVKLLEKEIEETAEQPEKAVETDFALEVKRLSEKKKTSNDYPIQKENEVKRKQESPRQQAQKEERHQMIRPIERSSSKNKESNCQLHKEVNQEERAERVETVEAYALPKQSSNKQITSTAPKKEYNEELLQELKDKFQQYKEAIDYFTTNNCDAKWKEAILKAKEIQEAQRLVEEGRAGEVDVLSLPGPITPSFICGYSEEERISKFTVIITEYINQMNDAQMRIEFILARVRNAEGNNLKKLAAQNKPELDALKIKKMKLSTLIQNFKADLVDPWIPAPLYIVTNEKERIEKINEDIPPKGVLILLGRTSYTKSFLFARLILEENMQEAKKMSTDSFDSRVLMQFDASVFKSLHKKELVIEIFRKR